MILTVDGHGRLRIPAALVPVKPGDKFDAFFDDEAGVLFLRRIKRKSAWLSVWKQCPVPMDDFPDRSGEPAKKSS